MFWYNFLLISTLKHLYKEHALISCNYFVWHNVYWSSGEEAHVTKEIVSMTAFDTFYFQAYLSKQYAVNILAKIDFRELLRANCNTMYAMSILSSEILLPLACAKYFFSFLQYAA